MGLLFWVVCLFIIAICVAIWFKDFAASLFIAYGGNLYEINLMTFILLLIISLFILYLLIKIISYIFSIPTRAREIYLHRNLDIASKNLTKAGIAYFDGEYSKSIKIVKSLILKNKSETHVKSLALIIGANSANKINDTVNRDLFLNKLEDKDNDIKISKNLLIAEGSIINDNYAVAKESIQEIEKINPNLDKALLLELKVSLQRDDNESVIKLSDQLYKNKFISKVEVDNYKIIAYTHLLENLHDIKSFKVLFKQIPKEYKENQLIVEIAQTYKKLGLYNDLLKWVLKYYPQTSNIYLLNILLASFSYFDDKQQLKITTSAEEWLLENTKDDKLLSFLGQITYLQKLWGKSRVYLEASFNINNDMHTGLILAKVLTSSGKNKEAQKLYDKFLSQIKTEGEILTK